MNEEKVGTIHSSTEGGVAGKHAPEEPFEFLVAPSTASEFNTVRPRLIPVACWQVDDTRFAFGSSFVRPEIRNELEQLAILMKQHRDCPISLFGHADPVGSDDYNKALSGRRAAAIYGLLTRDADIWDDLYSNNGKFTQPLPEDKWGPESIQTIRDELGPSSESAAGAAGHNELFLAYMEKLCVDADGKPFRLDKSKDFLAHHQDAGGQGDYQGCSEFNPLLIFSEADNTRFAQAADKTERNEANASNRRVMALIFRKGSQVAPAKWPCPRVKEGVAGCRKRFWSDGESRRTRRLPEEARMFKKTEDTFACRFYQRLTTGSPCETVHGRASWITEIPEGLDEAIFLLIRDGAGNEISRLKPDQARSGPEQNRTFDLSQLDANVPFRLELHAGEKFIAPIVNLAINALRVSLDLSNDAAAGASLFVAEPLAGPSDPLDENEPVDLSSEVFCPPIATPEDKLA
jgi:hypothetical protein